VFHDARHQSWPAFEIVRQLMPAIQCVTQFFDAFRARRFPTNMRLFMCLISLRQVFSLSENVAFRMSFRRNLPKYQQASV